MCEPVPDSRACTHAHTQVGLRIKGRGRDRGAGYEEAGASELRVTT